MNVFGDSPKQCPGGWMLESWLPRGQDQEGSDILDANQVCQVYLLSL